MTTVAFDVDGTLIHDDSDWRVGDAPRFDVIALYKLFEQFGCEMFIWSGGGTRYAAQWKRKLGLGGTVVEKGSFTPDIAIDDLPVDHELRAREKSLGKVNICVG